MEMDCDHTSGEMRAFVELRREEDCWVAVGFLVGQHHPEVVIEYDGGKEAAGNAIAEAGWLLGQEAQVLDSIMREDPTY